MIKITFNAKSYLAAMSESGAQLMIDAFQMDSSHGVEVHRIDRVTRVTRDGLEVPVEGLYDLLLADGRRVPSAIASDLILTDLLAPPSVQG
jgi:hypothetical protein